MELRPIVRHVFPGLSHWRPIAHNLPDTFFRLAARDHQLMPTPGAAQPEIHAAAQHKPLFAAAGVLFFHHKGIAYLNIHIVSLMS